MIHSERWWSNGSWIDCLFCEVAMAFMVSGTNESVTAAHLKLSGPKHTLLIVAPMLVAKCVNENTSEWTPPSAQPHPPNFRTIKV